MARTTRLRRLANSLVVRLVAFSILLIVLSQVLRLAILSDTLKTDFQEVVSAEQLALATYVAKDIDGKIRVRRQLLESLAEKFPLALLGQPKRLEAWLADRHALNPLFSLGLVVVPSDDREAVAEFPRVTQQGIIVLAAPILDVRGRVAAVIQGTSALDAPGFLDLIQDNPIGSTGGYLLISPRDNIFVAATMPKMRLRPLPPRGANLMHDRAMEGFRGTGVTVNAFGVEELVAFADVPAADWFVVARLPTAEAFQPVAKLRRTFLRNSFGIALIVVIVLMLFLRHTFRPMKEAASQMRRMADGKAPLEALPVARHDEVGEMVEGFNYLLAKLRESEARMAHLAHHDALTGLPNRLSFLARMQQGVALARRQENRLALMFIDLDSFKPINDVHGHEVGDQLLQQVAARLNEGVRESDAVARFGGDEFVLLLTGAPDSGNVAAIAEKIIARLSAPYAIDELELRIGASIGIALFPDDADDIDALIAQADAAMYDAKRCGRNCHRFAHKSDC